jgi:glycosyltransferase involved in cell wall biosynthesis
VATVEPDPPLVVAAARHIPEKRIPAIPAAVVAARERVPKLRCVILGDGPEREVTRAKVRALGLEEIVEMPGRAAPAEVMRTLAAASCLLHPSEREGYGLVVVEAASLGTPAIVVDSPENAAPELIEHGVNGSAEPKDLAHAIVEAVRGGSALRDSTLDWYERHRESLSIESSLVRVERSYERVEAGSSA